MAMQMGGVTIDCASPQELAEFWSAALGVTDVQDHGEYVLLATNGAYLGLQLVPEERAGKNRVHLDFHTDDRAAEVARLIGLGATEVEQHAIPGLAWTVLRDPEGNEFCVGSLSE
jgi:catechol 2,3-dioxygenase-like lactoylglutathione lyase family enzyme